MFKKYKGYPIENDVYYSPSSTGLTIADGLRIGVGKKNFEILKENLNDIITVDDEEIGQIRYLLWEKFK